MNLVLYDPHVWIRLLARRWQEQALESRLRVERWTEEAYALSERFTEIHAPKEKRKLIDIRRRVRAYTKGVPLTETLDDSELFAAELPELDAAQQVLLKKAYRLAVMMLHPDRGEETDEVRRMMANLRAAYNARDLKAVQEFVLHLQRSPLEQAAYWHAERDRPSIQWAEFKNTPAFQITQALKQGKPEEELAQAVRKFLKQEALLTEAHFINMQAHAILRDSDVEQFDTSMTTEANTPPHNQEP